MASLPPDAVRGGARAAGRREVLALALPAVASGLVQMAYHWINQVWVGRLPDGTTATAALSVANFTVWAYFACTSLVGAGLSALVGRYVGAGREPAAAWIAAQGLRWSLVLAVLVGGVGVLAAPHVFRAAQVSPAAASLGTLYVRIFFAGGFAVFLQTAADAVWRGRGDTRVPLLTSAVGLGLNALLDPLLIFGAGPVPGLGVPGAAVATVLSAGVAGSLSVRLLRAGGRLAWTRPPDAAIRLAPDTPLAPGPWPGFDLSVLARLVRVGAPLAASGLFFVGVYLAVSRVVARAGGDAAQAALGIGLRGEQVAWFLGQGFAVAAASLVALRLGAGRPDDAARAAWQATRLASVGCLAWALVLLLAPEALARLFLPGPGEALARARAVEYYGLVALCLVPQCWESVLDGAFAGAGLTVPPMLVSVGLTAARIPLAEWAAFGLGQGVRGIWVVIVATAALRGIVTAIWFARGTWKHRDV